MNALVRVAGRPFRDRVRRYVVDAVERDWEGRRASLEQQMGLTRIGDFQKDDVCIVGYRRSGTTWLQTLVAALVYGIDPVDTPYPVINELVPGQGHGYYRRIVEPMYFKGHYRPTPDLRRVIYLIRDGRDALASNVYLLPEFQGEGATPEEYVQNGDVLYGKWHEHVETWLANPFNADLLVIRYEDLKIDGVQELRRLCSFLGIERDDQYLQLLDDRASFQKLREKEAKEKESQQAPGKRYVRRGEVGGYKDEVPPHLVAAFEEQAATTLSRFGYLDTPCQSFAPDRNGSVVVVE